MLDALRPYLADCVRRAHRATRAPAFDVADIAPQDYLAVARCYSERRRFRVWSGGTATAIYGAPRVNWTFRAWHEWCHVRTGYDTSVRAEVRLALFQCAEAARVGGDMFARVVWLEVAGQALEFERSGDFLADQTAWTLARLADAGYPYTREAR